MSKILNAARKEGYAVPAVNVENMEMVQGVLEAAAELSSPIILQTTPSTLKYADPSFFSVLAKAASQNTDIPIVVHLDHGNSAALCKHCLDCGYTSLMIDGSKLAFKDNIAITKEVVDFAASKNTDVEGELGAVGGKEDGHQVLDKDAIYTNPKEAVDFVKQTGIKSLAVAIGTTHGFYTQPPKLDFERLEEIAKLISIPLVLHGSSGVPDADVVKCIKLGIAKVNFATEFRDIYTKAVRAVLEDKNIYDPKSYGKAARQAVKELAASKIKLCASSGKAR
jgi:tagatose 1,6-diphosphate aldolase GatY/KbaY